MKIEATPIDGVKVVSSTANVDHRGSFQRLYDDQELAPALADRRIVQINLSRTAQMGAVRGMHFQYAPHAELKVVRCLRGKVWDVAVDLREHSPTFLHWYAAELTPENSRMLVIPEGCAHGFQALAPDSELLYLHTAHYTPIAESGFRHDDPALAIRWPLAVTDLSQRDLSHPLITHDFSGLKT